MGKLLLLTGLCFLLSLLGGRAQGVRTVEEYLKQREAALSAENEVRLGADQRLDDPREVTVNEILMGFKSREYKEGLSSNGAHFASAQHIFHTLPLIEGSNVFKIIRLLPKGASLHLHDIIIPSVEWVARNLTYMDNLYYCLDTVSHLSFRFFDIPPTADCADKAQWRLVADLRKSASSPEFVDSMFIQGMSMYTPEPDVTYPTADQAWKFFEAKIATTAGITDYLPALRKHFYRTLEEHYDDNVMYIEERGLLSDVYHGNQTLLSPLEILQVKKEVMEEFQRDHADFWGVKYIFAPHRFRSPEDLVPLLNSAVEMKAFYPDFFAGFDLVGQEDRGTPLIDFLPQLLDAANKGVKFFFHAGETAWHGTKVDENLIDAILLNTTRIGHAYALASHPVLADEVQNRRIFIEVCPISNQVLKLVEDFRNHPVIPLMKEGFPLVIGSDDPGIWRTSALSYDWYVAFMAMAGAHADLRFLKQLALNSIEASAMSQAEKTVAFQKWENRWSTFLDKVIDIYG